MHPAYAALCFGCFVLWLHAWIYFFRFLCSIAGGNLFVWSIHFWALKLFKLPKVPCVAWSDRTLPHLSASCWSQAFVDRLNFFAGFLPPLASIVSWREGWESVLADALFGVTQWIMEVRRGTYLGIQPGGAAPRRMTHGTVYISNGQAPFYGVSAI